MQKEWDELTEAWNQAMNDGDWFQKYIIYPTVEKLIKINNKKIIDVGCGNGHLSRYLFKLGAFVTGIDNSSEMIKICKKNNTQIAYYNFDITKDNILLKNFDCAIFNNSLQDMAEYQKAIKNIYNILNKDGELLIIVKHPCFHPASSELGWKLKFDDGIISNTGQGLNPLLTETRNYKGIYFKMDDYFNLDYHIRFWYGKKTTSYSRTLEDYVNTICTNGFNIIGIYEPKPIESGYNKNKDLFNLLNRIPNFLVIHAEKGGKI